MPDPGRPNRHESPERESVGSVAERDLVARLRRVNLDLLPILDQLLRTRSVTRTAAYFGMTQPAVSRALRQLREIFADELLVPLGRGGRLTQRAEALASPLRTALREIDGMLQPQQPFDPATEALHIVISTADYVSLLLAPTMAEICAREAPHVAFEFAQRGIVDAADLDRIDFLIAPRAFGETLGKRLGAMPLWQDEMVCIAPADKTGIPDPISPDEFRALRHVGYQQSDRLPPHIRSMIQPTSALETDCVCMVRNFLVLGAIVETADCVALVPRKVAHELMRARALRIVDIDYAPKHLHLDAYWSLTANNKRGHAWFRDLLTRSAQRIG